MQVWEQILDSIPGLLCCVIDLSGKLIYSTQGYRAIMLRLFGHKCEVGKTYPPGLTDFDQDLTQTLQAAATQNESNALEINENAKSWVVTASPLKLDTQDPAGVIIKITPTHELNANKNPQAPTQNQPQKSPDILNSIPCVAILVDDAGKCLAVNKYSEGLIKTGDDIESIIDKNSRDALKELIAKRSGELACKIPDIIESEHRLVKISAAPSEFNNQSATVLVFNDVTELQRAKDQIHRLMRMETSTGFLNRQGLEHFILQAIRKSISDKITFSVIAIELNGLKKINSEKGYAYGDKILNAFAATLRAVIKDNDYTAGRWGGNDFMLIAECPQASAKVIANEIGEAFKFPDADINLFFGTSEFSTSRGIGVRDLISAAWDDLNEAKKRIANDIERV